MWLAAALLLLLGFGREISWGRVFFPVSSEGTGASFIAMRDWWARPYVYAFIGVASVVIAGSLYKGRHYVMKSIGLICESRAMRAYTVMFILLLTASQMALDRNIVRELSAVHEALEEYFELLAYWSLFCIMETLHRHIE